MSHPVPLTPAITPQSSQPSQRQARYDLQAQVAQNVQRVVMSDENFIDQEFGQRPKLPEAVFRRNFLPILTGEAFARQPDDAARQRLAAEAENIWLNIAGAPGVEVDVVEEDGTVAFTVPAMVNASLIATPQSMERSARALRHDNEDYLHELSTNPDAARARFTNNLSGRLNTLLRPEEARAEDQAKLDKMHSYYGIKGKSKEADANVAQASAGEMSFDD